MCHVVELYLDSLYRDIFYQLSKGDSRLWTFLTNFGPFENSGPFEPGGNCNINLIDRPNGYCFGIAGSDQCLVHTKVPPI